MFLNWFDSRDAEAFGNMLALRLHEILSANQKVADRKFAEKQKKAILEIVSMAERFGQAQPLNFYKKAKLGNAFRWELRDLGYDDALVEQMTKEILLALR